jgi:hypothetical protein
MATVADVKDAEKPVSAEASKDADTALAS